MSNTRTFNPPIDTYADQRSPSSQFLGQRYLLVNGSGSTGAKSYLLSVDLPRGLTITDAHYTLVAADPWTSTTLTTSRCTSRVGSAGFNSLTWAKQPTVTTSGQSSTSVSSKAAGDTITIDVTDIAQAWANGSRNYGVRITSSSTSGGTPAGQRKFHSSQASTLFRRPKLTVTGYLPTPVPTGHSPANNATVGTGTPQFSWQAQGAQWRTQEGYRVKIYSDEALTTLVEDSGWVVSSSNTYTATATLANGSSWWRTVQTRSHVGVEGPVSTAVKVTRANRPTVTISAPGTTVNDAMVTTSWSISAGTQLAWRVEHYDTNDASTNIADSGWVNDTDTSWTTDVSTQAQQGSRTVRVSVVTSVSPTTPQPGNPVQSIATKDYTYAAGATTAPTSLTATQTSPQPGTSLNFTCASPPDELVFWLNGVEVERGPSTDYLVSGTSYQYLDYLSRPRVENDWSVVAVVAGVDSPAATVDVTITPKYIWLLDPQEPTWWLAIADQDDAGLAFTEDSEVAYIRGSNRPQVITDTLRGYEGQISGSVYESLPDLGGLSAQSLRDRIWHLKLNPSRIYRLILSDQNIPVCVKEVQATLRPQAELQYGVTFYAVQQGEVGWELPT